MEISQVKRNLIMESVSITNKMMVVMAKMESSKDADMESAIEEFANLNHDATILRGKLEMIMLLEEEFEFISKKDKEEGKAIKA